MLLTCSIDAISKRATNDRIACIYYTKLCILLFVLIDKYCCRWSRNLNFIQQQKDVDVERLGKELIHFHVHAKREQLYLPGPQTVDFIPASAIAGTRMQAFSTGSENVSQSSS